MVGFNSLCLEKSPPMSVVGYHPVIPAPPTQLDVVYTLLKKSVQMVQKLGQEDAVVVVDQAVYAKALEVLWQRPLELKPVVLRLGAFHMTMAMLAVLGKRIDGSVV